MTDNNARPENGLSQSQCLRLDFLWQKGELRAKEQELAQREASLQNSIASENDRRKSAFYSSSTGQIENAQPSMLGSIMSGLSPPPSAAFDEFSVGLQHDINDSKAHWKKVTQARLVIWGRDVFEQFEQNARYICEYPTVSSFEEAIGLIAVDTHPDYRYTFEFAYAIADGQATTEEKAHFKKLKKAFDKNERRRKNLIRRRRFLSLITPAVTWVSWPFFGVALFMFISVEPIMSPLIPFALGFYAKKLFILVLIIFGAMFLTDVFASIYASLFVN